MQKSNAAEQKKKGDKESEAPISVPGKPDQELVNAILQVLPSVRSLLKLVKE